MATATDTQITRLRELARDYGLPEQAIGYVEDRIAGGLTQDAAYDLIRQLGARIQDWQAALPIKQGSARREENDEAELPLDRKRGAGPPSAQREGH